MITKSDERFFHQAIELAEFGEHRVRVGAVAIFKGNPIAGTFNTIRNITTNGVHFTALTRHAEMNCMAAVPFGLKKRVSLYVARIDSEGNLKPSHPCRNCMKALRVIGIKEVILWDLELRKIRP